jgi:hypothetical protein
MPNTQMDKITGRISKVLSNLAFGYWNQPFGLGDKLFPQITTTEKATKYPIFGKNHLQKSDDSRGPGDDPKRLDLGIVAFKEFDMVGYANEIALDKELKENNPIFDLQKVATFNLQQSAALNRESRIVTLATTASNYDDDHATTLTTGTYWDLADVNPFTAIKEAAWTIFEETGIFPNTLGLDIRTLSKLLKHPKAVEQIKYVGKKEASLTDLQDLISPDKTLRINVVVGSGGEWDIATEKFVPLWDRVAILAHTAQPLTAKTGDSIVSQMNLLRPSFGFTYARKGYPKILLGTDSYGGHFYNKVAIDSEYQSTIAFKEAGFLFKNTITPAS